MASEQDKAASSSEDEVSDAGSTESSPLVSDLELALPAGETSLEHRFFRQRREIAWRWTWLKLQCTDLRRQDKKCEETLARLREQKGRLEPLPLENDEETHALRTTGITPPKQNRKLIKRPPDVGQIRNPFQEAAAHTLFSLKPPVVKKAPEKKNNPLTASSASVASVATTVTNTSPDDQSSEAQHSVSVDQVPTVSVSGGAEGAEEEVEEEEEEDFYGEFYASDDSEEKARPRSHKRSSRGADDDATTPRRKMSRSVDFELPDTKALTASSGRSRRGLRASDWDVNNIVVPVSIASPRALQIVKPREIVTPGWKSSKEKEQREGQGEVRLIDEDAPAPKRADGAASSSSENTADELYATRHTPHEKAERARWEPLALQKKRLQQEAANQQPNDFIVTGEFDQMQSGGKGGKGAPRRLDFGSAPAPRSHKKGGSSHAHSSGGGGGSHASAGGSGANSRRMRPSRAGLYWMRSRFYADLKWELVRREGQADTVFVFRHVNGPIPHPPDRSAGGLKRNSVSDIVMEEDDEVEVTIRHRNPVPLSQATVAPVAPVAPPPTEPDPELAEAPYSPSRVGGDGLQMSANLSLSLASSVADATMAEAEELEMHDAQLERSGDVDVDGEGEGEGDIRPEESRTFEEEEEEEEEEEGAAHGKRGEGEGEEEGASPRQRAWAVRSMLNGVSEDSDAAIKVRSGASAAAKDSAASVSATATPAPAKTPAAAEQHAATHTTD